MMLFTQPEKLMFEVLHTSGFIKANQDESKHLKINGRLEPQPLNCPFIALSIELI